MPSSSWSGLDLVRWWDIESLQDSWNNISLNLK